MKKRHKEAERSAARERLKTAQDRLKGLEQLAGIREETDRGGAQNQRRLIFSVTDTALRRQIMVACRDCEVAHKDSRLANDDSNRYRHIIRTYDRNKRIEVAVSVSLLAVFLILLGHALGFTWELVGATLGVLWGVSAMLRGEKDIVRTIEEHKELLAVSEKNDAEWAAVKPLFSDTEIASGQPDKMRTPSAAASS